MAGSAGRSLTEYLPEAVATAAVELITGALLHEPRRVGKPLQRQLSGMWWARRGSYRILNEITRARATGRSPTEAAG